MKNIILAFCLLLTPFALTAGDLSPETIEGATTVDTAKAKALFDAGTKFVDVRRSSEFEAGRIPDAIPLDLKKAFSKESLAAQVKPDEAVVMYCNGPKCPRSAKASKMAVEWGYTKVYYYREGIPAWKAASNPVE